LPRGKATDFARRGPPRAPEGALHNVHTRAWTQSAANPIPHRPRRFARALMTWMQRLKRVFSIDLSECPWCGAQTRVIAEITDPKVITQILEHIATREGTARNPPLANAALHWVLTT
jgi:hypothetical protein